MKIEYKRHINKDEYNRIEFLFVNYDYHDGNELICRILEKYFDMKYKIKVDEVSGIWFSIIRAYDSNDEYELVWHEDVGNYMFSKDQSDEANDRLERRLDIVVEELNRLMRKR
ncbi:MAG: hypothetical protein VB031_01420 [Eubacteriaceae bacterium]|nr:hypothetical protein [Eubacteriaceae bacterium]